MAGSGSDALLIGLGAIPGAWLRLKLVNHFDPMVPKPRMSQVQFQHMQQQSQQQRGPLFPGMWDNVEMPGGFAPAGGVPDPSKDSFMA